MTAQAASQRFRIRSPWRALVVVYACLGLTACGGPPEIQWPVGFALSVRREAALRVLTALATLEGTPLAERAGRLVDRLPDCALLEGRDAAGRVREALESLHCRESTSAPNALERHRADRDLAFSWTSRAGPTAVLGAARVDPDGSVDASFEIPGDALGDATRLLMPGLRPAGPPRLADRDALVHLRVRPEGGLDIPSLVPSGSQGDRMFGLRGALFSGVVLDGTWEAALYVPVDGQRMPRAALALGVRQSSAALAAADAFVESLRETWPMRRSPFALGDDTGSCLPDLNLAPDLAPCFVVRDDELIVGWNAASLRHAATPTGRARFGNTGGALIAFDRFSRADLALADAWTGGSLGTPGGEPAELVRSLEYPWQRLVAEGQRRGEAVHLRLQFDAEGA